MSRIPVSFDVFQNWEVTVLQSQNGILPEENNVLEMADSFPRPQIRAERRAVENASV